MISLIFYNFAKILERIKRRRRFKDNKMASLLSEDVYHCILLFLDVNSYTMTQPFRISKVFNKAFNTEAFAKQFITNEFHLSESDVQIVTELFENDDEDDGDENDDDESNGNKNNDKNGDENNESPPRKKRKMSKPKMSNSKPKCFHDIFMKYCYCELKYGVVSSEKYITKQFSAYTTTRDSTFLSNIKQRAEYLAMSDRLMVDYSVRVYVTELETEVYGVSEPEAKICTVFELFGKGGYPVSIEALYREIVDDRGVQKIKEIVKVDGNKLFYHKLKRSVHHYFDTEHSENYSADILAYLAKVLGFECNLEEEDGDGPARSIYDYLQRAFGEKRCGYEEYCGDFSPLSK